MKSQLILKTLGIALLILYFSSCRKSLNEEATKQDTDHYIPLSKYLSATLPANHAILKSMKERPEMWRKMDSSLLAEANNYHKNKQNGAIINNEQSRIDATVSVFSNPAVVPVYCNFLVVSTLKINFQWEEGAFSGTITSLPLLTFNGWHKQDYFQSPPVNVGPEFNDVRAYTMIFSIDWYYPGTEQYCRMNYHAYGNIFEDATIKPTITIQAL
jgi:hypothetical protein